MEKIALANQKSQNSEIAWASRRFLREYLTHSLQTGFRMTVGSTVHEGDAILFHVSYMESPHPKRLHSKPSLKTTDKPTPSFTLQMKRQKPREPYTLFLVTPFNLVSTWSVFTFPGQPHKAGNAVRTPCWAPSSWHKTGHR